MTKAQVVAAFREKARLLYEGKAVPHRSCGMALAETFGREPRPYHALRRGGVTGIGECGAVVAGGLVLGELFGYPDSTAPTSVTLREAMIRYQALVARRLPKGPGGTIVCNDLVAPFRDFRSDERTLFCTVIASTVAEIVAEVALDLGARLEVTPIRDV
jgi:hypothetical protein